MRESRMDDEKLQEYTAIAIHESQAHPAPRRHPTQIPIILDYIASESERMCCIAWELITC